MVTKKPYSPYTIEVNVDNPYKDIKVDANTNNPYKDLKVDIDVGRTYREVPKGGQLGQVLTKLANDKYNWQDYLKIYDTYTDLPSDPLGNVLYYVKNTNTLYWHNGITYIAINDSEVKIKIHNESEEAHPYIQGLISTEESERKAADATEKSEREAADTTLQTNINTEISTRAQADISLQHSIDAEASTRGAKDTELETSIDNEVLRATEEEATLQSNIDAEASTARTAEQTLTQNLSAEITRAQGEESRIDGRVDEEAITRANADTGITNDLNAHKNNTNNPHNVTKSQVGLSDVDNKSEATIKSDFTGSIASGNTGFTLGGAVYTALAGKQDNLPTTVNDRYLHTNASTGALEWSEAGKVDDVTLNGTSVVDNKVAKLTTIDNVTSAGNQNPLTANQGKLLSDRISNLETLGRFLSVWNCTTGLPTTNPQDNPYLYKTGDYFIVGVVGETNYKPTGTQYNRTASTTVETNIIAVNDTYYYDGNGTWNLIHTVQPTVSFSALAGDPYDNTNLTVALNAKVTGNNAITSATHTKITYDSKGLVTSGADLTASDIPNLDTSKITTGQLPDSRIASASTWSGKQDAITSINKLSSDLVDDTNHTNKFVSSTDKTRFNALNVQYVDTTTPEIPIDLSQVIVDPCSCTYTFTWDGVGLKNTNCDPTGSMYSDTWAYGKITLNIPIATTITIGYSQSSESSYDYGIISTLDYELSKDITPETGTNIAFNGRDQGIQSGTITLNASSGPHFFTFKYIKDTSGAGGTDSFTITNITINSADFTGLIDYDTQTPLQELPIDTSNLVTTNTEQTITAKKSILVTEPIIRGGQTTALNVLSTHTSEEMDSMWAGRMKIGNKNKTFLLGVYKQDIMGQPAICGIGAHSWEDSEMETGAAWEDIYLNPDGNKAVYIGSHDWRADTGWFKVQNTGNDYDGKAYCNRGSITYPDWHEVATIYDDSAYSENETWSSNKLTTQFGYKENISNKVTSISSGSTNTQYPSAKCVYDIVGNIEATLQAIRGV